MTESASMPLYNEFTFFLKKYFPYKVQKISLNAGFTCPNRDGTKGLGAVHIVITRHSIPNTAKRKNPSPGNLKRGSSSLPINIRI